VANGEIWTVEDAERCREQSGCNALMLGRGIVADPGLALVLRGQVAPPWSQLQPLLLRYWLRIAHHVAPLFDAVRPLHDVAAVQALLEPAA
jgi:tRNA-dihydrouridine synthase C